MAYQPEQPIYGPVYQLETTDPVQGGVGGKSNQALLDLANRDAYLKKHVDDLESGNTIPVGVALLNGPDFTGNPRAPTAPLNDTDTSIANTEFVQKTMHGILAKSVAGSANVTLSTVEAGNAIFAFSGALTGNIAVIYPATAKKITVINRTTGNFTLTAKTSSGTGIAVSQGTQQELVCDGTNIILASNDFKDVSLSGNPTATTPALFDNDTSVATTAFVKRAMGSMRGLLPLYANTTIDAADMGMSYLMAGTASFTAALPPVANVPNGSTIKFSNITGFPMFVYGPSAGTLIIGSNGYTSVTLYPGESVEFITETNGWYAFGGSLVSRYSPAASSVINTAGWKRTPDNNVPNGYLLRQWQAVSVVNGAGIAFPVAFPNAILGLKITVQYGGAFAIAMPSNQSLSGFTCNHNYPGNALVYVESEGY